ncbi:hypothetical protein DFS34DRAFT_654811 [Phlyctochytrium arcticum]|nr:hypothetical protein DFS34DRAFT_654811 [Phlyctochytrium arcticum]
MTTGKAMDIATRRDKGATQAILANWFPDSDHSQKGFSQTMQMLKAASRNVQYPVYLDGNSEEFGPVEKLLQIRSCRRDPQAEGARSAEQQLSSRRLPNWKSVIQALQSNPSEITVCREQQEQRRLRRTERLSSSQFVDANLILDPIISLNFQKQTPEDQRRILIDATRHHLSHWVSVDTNAQVPHEALLPAGVNLLIKRCISIQQLDLAEEILKLYSQAIPDIDISTQNKYRLATPYNTLLAYHVQQENAAHCQTLLAQMLEKGIEPNSRTFHYLILGVEPENTQAAFQMLEHMQARKLRVSLDTLNAVLSKCLLEGNTYHEGANQAMVMLLEMYPPREGVRQGPNVTTACVLLRHTRGDPELEMVFKDLQRWTILRSPLVQKELLQAAGRNSKSDSPLARYLDWAHRLAGLGIPLQNLASDLIIQAHGQAGSSLNALMYSESSGSIPSDETLLGLLRSVGTSSNQDASVPRTEETAWKIWKYWRESSKKPSQKMFIEFVKALGRSGDRYGLEYVYKLIRDFDTLSSTTLSTEQSADRKVILGVKRDDRQLHTAFIKAFGSSPTRDYSTAIEIFESGPNEEKHFFDLLHTIKHQKEAREVLNDCLATAVARGTPLTPANLERAFTSLNERLKLGTLTPMAFSATSELERSGVWNPSASGPRSELQLQATREAILRVAAHEVADMTQSVRGGVDVEQAISTLKDMLVEKVVADDKIEKSSVQAAISQLDSLHR